jgi:hypothetical protein
MPEPSGAQVGWATSWLVTTFWRVPSFLPFQDAMTRYDSCFW